MSNLILNGDFSSGFDHWTNGVGGEPYTLDAEKIRGISLWNSGAEVTYGIMQVFESSGTVATATATVWAKWQAEYGDLQTGRNRFIVELQKPDFSYVTLIDTTKEAMTGNGNILDGLNIAAHMTQSGTYRLFLYLKTRSAYCSADPPEMPNPYYIQSYGWYDNISIDVTYVAGTNMKINIGDVFKDVDGIKINIGDSWKTVTKIQINVGDTWKTVFG